MIRGAAIPAGDIFRFLKYFWEQWNIQAVVLASLAFQIVLIFAAPSRKRTKSSSCVLTLWSIYLLADYFAIFAIGLINNGSQMQPGTTTETTGSSSNPCGPFKRNSIAAFWAPFLLLHLGGPDTITAFAIEDNELWHRHLLSLIVQVLSVLLVFFRYQILTNEFLIPTALTFTAGVIKYAERTRSLYLAALTNMKSSMRQKPDAGPDYAQLMEEMESKQKANLPVTIDINREKAAKADKEDGSVQLLGDLEVVEFGRKFYRIFRGLIVDHMFSFLERDKSRSFFLSLESTDAFKVMGVELNFMYDAMFSKMNTVHGKSFGYAFRFTCTALIVTATVLFSLHPREHLNPRDLIVTYCLLGGGVALDVIAIVELIFSKWTVALLLNSEMSVTARSCGNFKKRVAIKINRVKGWIPTKRWSEDMHQYSLINHCLKKRWKWAYTIIELLGLTETIDSCLYSKPLEVEEGLKKLIFDEIKKKGKQATKTSIAKEISSSKGEWALLEYQCGPAILSTVSQDKDYDECVLMWHIATEIFYFSTKKTNNQDGDPKASDPHPDNVSTKEKNNQDGDPKSISMADICRYISEYLLYLLVMERKMTSAAAGIVEIRFRDTCEEAMNFFSRGQQRQQTWSFRSSSCLPTFEEAKTACGLYLSSMMESTWEDVKYYFTLSCFRTKGRKRKPTKWERHQNAKEDEKRKEACERLESINPQVEPAQVKGDRSKSLLFDACILARDLKDLSTQNNDQGNSPFSEDRVWEMMSKVWVELLSYGACHCRGDAHAQYLSKGGELLTFVWLLMAHFGLGEQFRIEAGHARAKLIVGKEKN